MTDASSSPQSSGPRRLICPQCKARYVPTRNVVGRRIKCRHCGHVWRDTSKTIQEITGALEQAAAPWQQIGSTVLNAADHASTVAGLVRDLLPTPQAPPGEWVGRTLGKYRIKSVLGQGAMGNVYEAVDPTLDRVVAIKMLPRRMETTRESIGLRMFLQEARIAAKLQHPNIVTIHEVDQQDGLYYFVMEHVQGVTLGHLVESAGPLPANQAIYIIAHAARALAAGHALGVVHRDVKPGNIMIDRRGQVKVTDFGLADLSTVEGVAELSEKALGTPGWISPEVARGEKATPASDIYGLGLVAYYALTKQRLVRAATRSAMVRMQAKAKSIRAADLPPGWPPRLRDAIVQCLQADPADRYQSADALAADLLRALAPSGQDITLLLDAAQSTHSRRWLSREAIFAVAGAAATALFIAFLWWLLY
ncbi:MAG: hypothetical protein HBSAPP02_25610 [Phycisphaerae bacterium]|nr:MAG: protein kinase [Planctomycetia bacterium]RIK67394.1 MAG: hypothetical protein DCC66_11905 [Planctomycetota bacterium]GJQ27529.1 MAG: hypothetical protein HBSAPP02_25610 [Phycisphaerae bacterium]